MADSQPPRSTLGVYPGSFDPPTVAHLHIAERAVEQLGLVRLDLTISTATLGKDDGAMTPLAERLAELERLTQGRAELGVRSTPKSLLVDVADGYDVVVVGADKWHQLLDPDWYGSPEARDDALRRLPTVALAARPPWTMPGESDAEPVPDGLDVVVLDTDPQHHPVSASDVRAGRHEWRARPRL